MKLITVTMDITMFENEKEKDEIFPHFDFGQTIREICK